MNNASPWENDWGLMITILKTARIVRFVRASAVATIIGKVNWYWPQQKVSAVANHYLQCCSTGIDNNAAAAAANSQEENNNNNNNGDNSEHPTNTTNANTTTNATNAKVNVNANAYAASNNRYTTMAAATTRRKDFSDSSPANHYQANANWGGLGTATLAAVKAKGQAIERQEQKKRKQSKGGNIMAAFLQKVLQTLGLMPIKDTVGQKHLAASKIQRAWRRAVAKHAAGIDHLEHFQEEVGGNGGMIRNNNNNAGGTISTAAAAAAGKTNSWNHSASYNKKEQATTSKKKMFHKLPGTSKGSVNANGLPITTATSNPNKTGKPIYTADGVAESQVGGAMRELTGQRVAIGMICALLLTAMFTYVENDASRPATMVILHRQTTGTKATKDGTATILVPPPEEHVQMALKAARQSSVPDMYRFELHTDQKTISEDLNRLNTNNEADLRDCEKLKIIIKSTNYSSPTKELVRSIGYFDYKQERRNQAYVQLFSTIFILLLWLFGVTAFAGPVMVLVVLPIERMVRLLGMLMMDPLGYQSTSRYRRFVAEEDQLTKNTRWTKEVLKGMETSFLMSTILRIGSLMKVGFGSAGVEIIRKNLEKKQGGKVNLLTTKGLTVSCIFLFCDIRQFTGMYG